MTRPEHRTLEEAVLSDYLPYSPEVLSIQPLSGGCINEAVKVDTSEGSFFLKWNQPDHLDQFRKEAAGLGLLSQTGCITVPNVLKAGSLHHSAYLLLEYISPEPPHPSFWEDFGRRMAQLHQHSSPNAQYGLEVNNYIGRLAQQNNWNPSWIEFFITHRLEVQLSLAYGQGLVTSELMARFRRLYNQLPNLLPEAPPSLIHGDLWSGNFLCGPGGRAALIDPAVYYGHREIELAFTRLFGGFTSTFYDSYQEAWPLDPGFEQRVELYNLYPLLVHINLFGQSYLSGITEVVKKYT